MSDVNIERQKVSELSAEIRSKLMERGASLVGYADLSALPEDEREGYRYGIAIAVQLRPETVRRLKDGPDMHYYHEYKRINALLDELDEYAAQILREKGLRPSQRHGAMLWRMKKHGQRCCRIKPLQPGRDLAG